MDFFEFNKKIEGKDVKLFVEKLVGKELPISENKKSKLIKYEGETFAFEKDLSDNEKEYFKEYLQDEIIKYLNE